jgi:Na+/proline symporter
MNGFLRATFNGQKFQGLFINTALGNFAGYVAGSLVTVLSTHHAVERRAVSNLFGVLPRKQIVVHILPHWLEWLLALIVGFLVMEAVRYWFNHRKYLALLSALRAKRRTKSGRLGPGPSEPGERCVSDGCVPQEALPQSGGMSPLEPT